jgi:hypothetical protein
LKEILLPGRQGAVPGLHKRRDIKRRRLRLRKPPEHE